jgi:hypothetical protein
LKNNPQNRIYPQINSDLPKPTLPISFICVKYSNDFLYNIDASQCVHDDLNEFIVIDNQSDIYFQTLGQAINEGIAKAHNDLVVIVHEDIFFAPGWQAMFEKSLLELEKEITNWLLIGLVGVNREGKTTGHCSDPHKYYNSFSNKSFIKVATVDEQVLVIRKSKNLFPDPELPSIHNIGRDMVLRADNLYSLPGMLR